MLSLPKGFLLSATACGLRKKRLDLALIFSEVPALTTGLYTTNKFPAAPIKIAKARLKKSAFCQAVLINSGNANSFTGEQGIKDAKDIIDFLAKKLGIDKNKVHISSTGIIGKRLPIEKIKNGIPFLVNNLSRKNLYKVARAILTTDTVIKITSKKIKIGLKTVTLIGIAKGSGMIAPSLATMLCFIITDARITKMALEKAVKKSVNNSFNCITVDGCMSTNDTVLVLANGQANNSLIDITGKNFRSFSLALSDICLDLAKMVVKDGEGATKFIEIKIRGTENNTQAKKAALAIANSNLFKAAIYGRNPNWGRIVSAIGASGIKVREDNINIKFSSLKKKNIFIEANLGKGKGSSTIYTSDLTPEYVKINAEYN